ncbi:MAG: helix-turn-helix transcriptional regulator [Alphaproteobacteria bacterium]
MKESIPPHRINAILKTKGLSNNWLAKESGGTRQHVGRMLSGKSPLTMEWVLKFSKTLKVKPSDLAGIHLDKRVGKDLDHAFLGSIIGWLLTASHEEKVKISKDQMGKLTSFIYKEATDFPLSFDHARHLTFSIIKALKISHSGR